MEYRPRGAVKYLQLTGHHHLRTLSEQQVIDLTDALVSLDSFGHDCTAP